MPKPRILLGDDHSVVVKGIIGLLECSYEVVGTAENGKAQGIPVRLDDALQDASLTVQTASCLFRVAQESVQNAVKHGAATQVYVSLSADRDFVQLRVSDNGAGFAAGPGRAGLGLGLVNMKERMRLVNGEFSITSRPGRGTEIVASAPLSGDSRAKATKSVG